MMVAYDLTRACVKLLPVANSPSLFPLESSLEPGGVETKIVAVA